MNNNFTFFIFISLLTVGCGSSERPAEKKISTESLNIHQPPLPKNAVKVPNFTLSTTSGEIVKMDDLLGKVVLVNFWGTWCGPCRAEIPDFVELYNKHHDQGLEIVGITLTSGSPEKIQAFADQWNMNYTVLTDIQGNETQQVTADYGRATGGPIVGIPTTFLVDRNGYIVKRYLGPRPEKIFYNDIKPYL